MRGPITSPTFVIARVHPPVAVGVGRPRSALVHVDAYRLGSALELDDLDLDTDSRPRSRWWSGARGWPKGCRPIAWRSRSTSGCRRAPRGSRRIADDAGRRYAAHGAGIGRSASAGKASTCPSWALLIVYSSALYPFRFALCLLSRSPTPHRRHALTQDGSFPGRPRGRRARHDNDPPEMVGI